MTRWVPVTVLMHLMTIGGGIPSLDCYIHLFPLHRSDLAALQGHGKTSLERARGTPSRSPDEESCPILVRSTVDDCRRCLEDSARPAIRRSREGRTNDEVEDECDHTQPEQELDEPEETEST